MDGRAQWETAVGRQGRGRGSIFSVRVYDVMVPSVRGADSLGYPLPGAFSPLGLGGIVCRLWEGGSVLRVRQVGV